VPINLHLTRGTEDDCIVSPQGTVLSDRPQETGGYIIIRVGLPAVVRSPGTPLVYPPLLADHRRQEARGFSTLQILRARRRAGFDPFFTTETTNDRRFRRSDGNLEKFRTVRAHLNDTRSPQFFFFARECANIALSSTIEQSADRRSSYSVILLNASDKKRTIGDTR